MKIAFIGGGNMTLALVGGLLKTVAPESIIVADRNTDKRHALQTKYGIAVTAEQGALPADIELLVLSVKPADIRPVCAQISRPPPVIVSIAAGLTIQTLCGWMRTAPPSIVRVMPNTPVSAGAGMSVCYAAPIASAEKMRVSALFESVGQVTWVTDETMLDVATAVSGSGPAYFYYFAEAMEEAALEMGMNAATARQLVLQTMLGSHAMMASHAMTPPGNATTAALRQAVMSKGGTTERAIAVMEAQKLKTTVKEAMRACRARAEEIGKDLAAS